MDFSRPTNALNELSIRFGSFRLFPQRRVLLDGDRPVRLGSRAFDILHVLAENAGEVISNERLIAHVWPETFVEETNLRVHLAALRKILREGRDGQRFIVNVVGRGYSFVAPCSRDVAPSGALPSAEPVDLAGRLPAFLGPLIGRSEAVDAIAEQVLKHRFLTICGSPGIGKTSVALAVAERLTRDFERRVTFVDLGLIADPRQLTTSVATSLGIPVVSSDVLELIIDHLKGGRTLIVLDNCEHVIDAAAEFCEQALKRGGELSILATSREALRVVGERLYRLPPLPTPAIAAASTLGQALEFAAVELFVNRAAASQDTLRFTEEDVPAIADICRKLDGLPLAIELAAARVELLGVQGLAKRLDDQLQLLRQGRRTALPRHQTLSATLDWSYGLLTDLQQRILMRLSVFAGSFTSEAAMAVAGNYAAGDVEEQIGDLAAKSLLNVDITRSTPRYRLLEITRAYASDKLQKSGDLDDAARRHADHCLWSLKDAELKFESTEPTIWQSEYRPLIDDIRSAIDWAMEGDQERRGLGIALTDCAATLFFQLHLSEEYRNRLERALKDASEEPGLEPELEMRICISLSVAIFNTNGPAPELAAASTRALTLAESLDTDAYQLRALWGLARERYSSGDYSKALEYSERFGAVARKTGNEEAILVHARMMSLALHLVGRHDEARDFAAQAVSPPKQALRPHHRNFYQYDFGVTARAHLARILWIRGWQVEAAAVAEEAVVKAMAIGSPISLCNALALGACPVAIWAGDRALAQARVSLLIEYSSAASLGYWNRWGRIYQGALDLSDDRPTLKIDSEYSALQIDILGTLDRRLIISSAVERANAGTAPWSAAEVLRGQCMNRYTMGLINHAAKLEMLHQAQAIARAQNARSWELRCAIDIAESCIHDGQREAGEAALTAALARLESVQSLDVRRAEALLRHR